MASSSAGDCAFEDDMCGWSNPGPSDGMDELNWERLEARSEQRFPQVSFIFIFHIPSTILLKKCMLYVINGQMTK